MIDIWLIACQIYPLVIVVVVLLTAKKYERAEKNEKKVKTGAVTESLEYSDCKFNTKACGKRKSNIQMKTPKQGAKK